MRNEEKITQQKIKQKYLNWLLVIFWYAKGVDVYWNEYHLASLCRKLDKLKAVQIAKVNTNPSFDQINCVGLWSTAQEWTRKEIKAKNVTIVTSHLVPKMFMRHVKWTMHSYYFHFHDAICGQFAIFWTLVYWIFSTRS